MHKNWHLGAASALALLMAGAAGCGGEEPPPPEPATTGPALSPEQQRRMARAEQLRQRKLRRSAAAAEKQAAQPGPVDGEPIPAAYPSELPDYPGAKQVAAYDGGEQVTMIVWETPDGAAEVVEFLKSQYGAAGWTVEASWVLGDDGMVMANKDDRALIATFRKGESVNRIGVVLTQLQASPEQAAAQP